MRRASRIDHRLDGLHETCFDHRLAERGVRRGNADAGRERVDRDQMQDLADSRAGVWVIIPHNSSSVGLSHAWSYRYSTSLELQERLHLGVSVCGAAIGNAGDLLIYGHDEKERPQVTVHDPRSLERRHGCKLDGIASVSRGGVAFAGDVAVAGRGNGSVGKWKGAKCIQEPTGGDAGKYLEYLVQWELGPLAYDADSDRLYAGYTGLEDDGARYPALRCIEASSGATIWDQRIAAPLWAIALTPDGKRLVATTADSRAVAADVDYVAQHGLA